MSPETPESPESADRPAPSRRGRILRGGRARKARPVISAAVATTVLLGTGTASTAEVAAQSRGSTTMAAARTGTTAPATPSQGFANAVAVQAHREPVVDWEKVLSEALEDVAGGASAKYSVAIMDTESGDSAVYGSGSYDTASIVKVDILAALLLQAQDDGRDLTTREKSYAKVMIRSSDNAAAAALWREIGGSSGLNTANKRLGLTETTGGSGVYWGLTQTTAADQLKLLQAVFGDDSELSDASRQYIRSLMGQVSIYQDWGVPSAASGDFEVKNGWLQRSRTALWDINSIGRVTSGGHTYLVAVTSKGSTTQGKGIALVEKAAKAAVRAFDKAAADAQS